MIMLTRSSERIFNPMRYTGRLFSKQLTSQLCFNLGKTQYNIYERFVVSNKALDMEIVAIS